MRIGLMGFGRIGRQIYQLAMSDPRFEIVAISDIGQPAILHNLLESMLGRRGSVELQTNYLVSDAGRARLMPADRPTEIPWDVFEVDVVIDATGRFRTRDELMPHVDNGAARVITSTLPVGDVDRVVLFGVNEDQASVADRIVSAGSASTTAAALLLSVVQAHWPIEQASMTSVHAYTSDQSLQDHAGPDIRRSRSGAENIIPNDTPASDWIQRLMPQLHGRFSGYALNVPVQVGSMLDLTVVLAGAGTHIDVLRETLRAAAAHTPRLLSATSDLIVSSDVRGIDQSAVIDLEATMMAGTHMLKLIAWHETLGHARRILDIAGHYADIDAGQLKETA